MSEPDQVRCLQCERLLSPAEEREVTDRGAFCAPCFARLRQQVEFAVRQQGQDINHLNAILGGVLGGAAGAAVWWGFTVVTKVAFGLVAIVIGLLVGKGVVMFSGGKRARSLQVIAVVVATAAYFYASYLVTRTFILRAAETGLVLPLLPPPALMVAVIRAGFQFFDVVFLAIVIYQAWKIPAPFKLAG